MTSHALSLLNTTFTEPGDRAKAFGIFSAISGAEAAPVCSQP